MADGDNGKKNVKENGNRHFVGGDIDKQHHGVLSFGIGPIRIGWDSESIRHTFQNRIAHDRFWMYNNGENYDPALITAKVETDCSALVRLCLAYAGIFVGDFCTTDEYDVIMDTGRFINVTNPAGRNPDYLRRGDILVTKVKGHTVVVLTDGKNVVKAKGEQVDNFVLVEDNMAVIYKLRTIEIVNGVAMEGGDVLLVQEILRARGYKGRDGKPLKLDGHTGNDYETSNTMYAIACYIEDRLKNGVDLGGKDGWGPKCWADQNFIVAEA